MANDPDVDDQDFWRHVRDLFVLEHPRVNLAASAVAPHPHVVRQAITRYADGFDAEGWPYLSLHLTDAEKRTRVAVAAFCEMGEDMDRNVALTGGTLQGLGVLYAGLKIGPDKKVIASNHEFPLVHTMLKARQDREYRSDFIRGIDLFDKLPNFDPNAVVRRIEAELEDRRVRVLALTWVYSNTGVKLPIPAISEVVRTKNAGRAPEDRILFCVDGIHGFGVEDTTFPALGCDFFISGCHKWVFGPRGTGVLLGTDESWKEVVAVIPSTTGASTAGQANTPGGVHSYELRWALDEALRLLERRVGKRRIQERVHRLAARVKKALLCMPHIALVTPVAPDHSSGLICFDVRDAKGAPFPSGTVVAMLRQAGVVATNSSGNNAQPTVFHVRVAVSILNSDDEIARAIEAIGNLV